MIRDTVWSRWFAALLALVLAVVFIAYQWAASYSLDIGAIKADDDLFIAGFHQRESNPADDYRWTGSHASIMLPGMGRGRPWTLVLYLSGYRPYGQPSPQVTLSINGHLLARFVAEEGMAEYRFQTEPAMIGLSGDVLVEITPQVFSPEGDPRELGLLISRISLESAGGGIVVPSPATQLLIAGSVIVLFLFLRWMGVSAALAFCTSLLLLLVLGFVAAMHRQYVTWYSLLVLLLLTGAAVASALLERAVAWSARRFRSRTVNDVETRPLLGMLLLALACYLALLPTPGFVGDMAVFMLWSWKLTTAGLHTAYLPQPLVGPVDWLPLIPYMFSLVGSLYRRLFAPSFPFPLDQTTLLFYSVLKLPIIAADIGTGVVIFVFLRRRTSQRLALLSMAAYLFNPAVLFNSAYGGQADAIHSLFAILAVALVLEKQVVGAWLSIALAALCKPQGALFLPLILLLTWKQYGVLAVLKGLVAATIIVLLVFSPFMCHGTWDSLLGFLTSIGRLDFPWMPPHTTVGAHNLWWVLGFGSEVADTAGPMSQLPFIGSLLMPRTIGLTLLVMMYGLGLFRVWKSGDEWLVPIVAAYVAFVCYMTLTQVHARYAFSMLPFLAMALPCARRWSLMYLALTVTFLANLSLNDAALLDMLGILDRERLLHLVKYLNALANLGLLVYWTALLLSGWRWRRGTAGGTLQERQVA